MNDVIERILVTEEEIIKRSKELGAVITQDYRDAGKTPIVVGLLKGSVPFLAEIMKHIDLDIEIDFMDVSSYDGAQSVGDVKINKDLDKSVKGESILLVEDIVDTGRTLKEVKKLLLHRTEIRKLQGKIAEKGYTLVPLQVYFKKSLIKVEIGLARGKKLYDKRQDIAKKDQKREAQREFKIRNFG